MAYTGKGWFWQALPLLCMGNICIITSLSIAHITDSFSVQNGDHLPGKLVLVVIFWTDCFDSTSSGCCSCTGAGATAASAW